MPVLGVKSHPEFPSHSLDAGPNFALRTPRNSPLRLSLQPQ